MQKLINKLLEGNRLSLITGAYSILVTILFLMPGSDIPGVEIPFIDKWVHIGLFLALSLLWTLLLDRKDLAYTKAMVLLFLLLLFYGMVIELIQHTLLPTRTADPWDVLANTIGILLGIWMGRRLGQTKGLKV